MTPGPERQNPTPITIAHKSEKTQNATAAPDTANAFMDGAIPHHEMTIWIAASTNKANTNLLYGGVVAKKYSKCKF